MPYTAERLRDEMERRVEARARELADADRIEREVQRRAEERARELFEQRAFRVLTPPGPQDGSDGAGASGQVTGQVGDVERATEPRVRLVTPPPGLTREDIERPWQRPKPRPFHR